MSDYFLGEIRAFAFPWAPRGWAICDGRTMPVQQNAALFSLLGVQFGGDGRTTFNLPDLQGRAPVHLGGQTSLPSAVTKAGRETVTLATSEMPAHSHAFVATTNVATDLKAAGKVLATTPNDMSQPPVLRPIYGSGATTVQLASATLGMTGSSQPHSNMQPFLVVNYCIALQGVYPPRE